MQNKQKIFLGIAAAITANILWSVVFLTPQILSDFSPLEISYGRFVFFGLFSLLYAAPAKRMLQQFTRKEIFLVVCFSATGFWLYTIFLVHAVQSSGGVLASLIIGLLPITIALFGKKTRALQKDFFAGLALIFLGLIVLEVVPFAMQSHAINPFSLIGLLSLFSCLAMWTWYGIKNSDFLKDKPQISKRDYTSLLGIISLVFLLVLGGFMIDFPALIHHQDFNIYLLMSVLLGLGSTWLAYWLWNICSQLCPPQISGPLIIFETIFGVVFTFIHQGRFPSAMESAAILLFASGAFLSIRSEVKQLQN